MNLFWRKQSNEIVGGYISQIEGNKQAKLDKKECELFDLLMKRVAVNDDDADYFLRSLMERGEISYIHQLFEGWRYPVLHYMLGTELAEKYVAWLHILAVIPYTEGYYRRPLRSGNAGMQYIKALDNLKDFLAIAASGLTLEVLMEGGRTEDERCFIQEINYFHLLSVEINAGNETIIQKVKDCICSDNTAGQISYSLLQGIVMSNNRELYELEGKLLLAARLQEGLRQSIAETMDSGTTEAFLYLFGIIRANDLQRFSSIKRAVGTWTGLVGDADADRVNQKVMDLIYTLLTDASYVQACLQSKDSMELYMALWAKGFYQMEEVAPCADAILKEGIRHKIQVLFYYLTTTSCDWLREKLGKQALELYPDDPSLMVSYLDSYLTGTSLSSYSATSKEGHSYFESLEEAHREYGLLKTMAESTTKTQTFSPFIFPWHSAELSRQRILEKMACIVYIIGSDQLLDDLCGYYEQLDSTVRQHVIRELLKVPSTRIHYDTLVKALGDRAEMPRKEAYKILSQSSLSDEQYIQIEELLKYKAGNLRQQAIRLLLQQEPEKLPGTIERLLTASVTEKRLAGLDLLLTLRKKKDQEAVYQQSVSLVSRIARPSSKEQLLIDQLTPQVEATKEYSRENGFGLYEKADKVSLPTQSVDADFDIRQAFPLLQDGSFLKKLFGKKQTGVYEILQKLGTLLTENANYEYCSRYGQTVLFGNCFWEIEGAEDIACDLDKYPLAAIWRKFYEEEVGGFDILLQIAYALNTEWGDQYDYGNVSLVGQMYTPAIKSFYGFDLDALRKKVAELPFYTTLVEIINLLCSAYWEHTYAGRLAKNILTSFCAQLSEKDFSKTCEYEYYNHTEKHTTFIFQDSRIAYWLSESFGWQNEEEFARYFTLRYHFYHKAYFLKVTPKSLSDERYLSILDFAKAYSLQLIPESELIKELMTRQKAEDSLYLLSRYLGDTLTPWQRENVSRYEGMELSGCKEVVRKVIARILEIELKRGDTPTDVSPLAMKIERVEGAAYLVKILTAFGKDTFGRSDYYYNSSYTRKEVLSKLLRCSYPLETDTAEVLQALLPGTGITETRLIEAAMYAPQWLDTVEKCIQWKGFTSAAYYFHAHINEWCDDQKKAIIARYTPIEPDDLRLGAFDINWFRDAYHEIGAERFEVVYDAAKYISSGAGHTRARKYADAVNGKMNAAEVKKQIVEKRNKDLLMSYCLIPLDKKKTTPDLLERYQYLQQFLKESKTFGSQRQESEKKAVEIGMQNLARNAGYSDVTRLTWSMETELIKEMEPYFTPCEIEGVEVYVEIDADGKSELNYVKAGKTLSSLPARLKKNAYINELKEVHKKLKNQYSRSRLMLEQAMEDEQTFFIYELSRLTHNPVVWPLLRPLVFVSQEQVGFFTEGGLVTPDGEFVALLPETEVRMAHPVDLQARGVWHTYQKHLFANEIRQPFKQVFRELYVKTDEERPMTHSLRYAGNQIQPQKTVALLKTRRWVANYEEGLQKVYYKENIIASIYALADWFSPADIEAPTLEWVAFQNRKTYEPLTVAEIPDVIFSEVMRDVDLAVSVAHAGSVDPEASHSTIEMRRALIAFTLPLFKLTNVTLEGSHAFIQGSLGKYNIHLGSGVIHQEAGAALNVLPVHSQHRGRLFLPFVDEDPKTAEVLSKILLFADDRKIKDPFILQQISITL